MTENDMECYDKKILNQKGKRERKGAREGKKTATRNIFIFDSITFIKRKCT